MSLHRPVKVPSLVIYQNGEVMQTALLVAEAGDAPTTVASCYLHHDLPLLAPSGMSKRRLLDTYVRHQSAQQEKEIVPASLLFVEEGKVNHTPPQWADTWARPRDIPAHSRTLPDCDGAVVSLRVQRSHALGPDLEMTDPVTDAFLYIHTDSRKASWVNGQGEFTPIEGAELPRGHRQRAGSLGNFAGELVMARAQGTADQRGSVPRALRAISGVVLAGSGIRKLPERARRRYQDEAREALASFIEVDAGLSASNAPNVGCLDARDLMLGLAALAA